ncbi:hypothetical protein SEA_ZUKO_29 [Streptomyces phage Zuko]|uniref:Glycine-rich domain-containing protein n=1 Tax=Streptomyces phage Zuko TaxID=2601695 RepID=A0A5J6D722_9CAUD|nr:hypothetical protein PP630_gp029 [Streptomyces phage Zuko]QEQ93607.1 hypothetical protein SEA_ZUKO_29 [Streptomyces phage Zuko]
MAGSGSSRKAHDFLRVIKGFSEANPDPNVENRPIRLGTVDYDYDPNDFLGGIYPRIMFDGEKVVSQKRYKTMVGYYPLPGHRVVLVPVGTTYLIIGTVSMASQDPKVDIFTSTDTWDKPAGARTILVQCQAGGGAGGGCVATAANEVCAGGGGSGGAYAESVLTGNSVTSSVTVTVGTGGTGGTGTGGNGTTSSFGSYVSASGGVGGGSTGASSVSNAGISGATAASQTMTGDIQINGQGGGAGMRQISGVTMGGMGGNSYLGGGGRGCSAAGAQVAGTAGMGYGGGGGGACSGTTADGAINGGDGAPGIVIVTTYF